MTTIVSQNLVEACVALLDKLNRDDKLELIARLSQSMKESNSLKTDDSLLSLFGALKGDETADKIIENLRNSRTENRPPEPF